MELMAKGAQIPGILTCPSLPLLGHPIPDMVQTSRVMGPGDESCLTDGPVCLCQILSFLASPVPPDGP